jgi:hypothetical protein
LPALRPSVLRGSPSAHQRCCKRQHRQRNGAQMDLIVTLLRHKSSFFTDIVAW